MKTTLVDDLIFSEELCDKLKLVAEAEHLPFSELAAKAELDPKHDFQHADLCGVDFSDSDLSGYNFRGADLSQAKGARVRLDAHTNFEDANTKSSIFEMEAARRSLMRMPHLRSDYKKLAGKFWTDLVAEIVDRALDSKRDPWENWAVLTQLFNDNTAVRSTILDAIERTRPNTEILLAFLVNLCRDPETTPTLLARVLRKLRRHFPRRKISKDVFLTHVSSPAHVVRAEAITASLTLEPDDATIKQVSKLQRAETYRPNRRLFVQLMTSVMRARTGLPFDRLFMDPSRNYGDEEWLDWQRPLYPSVIRKLILSGDTALDIAASAQGRQDLDEYRRTSLNVRRSNTFSEMLEDAIQFGIPFQKMEEPPDRVY